MSIFTTPLPRWNAGTRVYGVFQVVPFSERGPDGTWAAAQGLGGHAGLSN
jgi:hypothetical protein